MSEEPILCDRCLCELRAGRGQYYEVRIEAVADPTVTIDEDELNGHGDVSSAEKFSVSGSCWRSDIVMHFPTKRPPRPRVVGEEDCSASLSVKIRHDPHDLASWVSAIH